MNKEQEYAVINNTVSTLAVMCAGDTAKIIDLLTGYLWDEEEAGEIKDAPQHPVSADAQCDHDWQVVPGKPVAVYRCSKCPKVCR